MFKKTLFVFLTLLSPMVFADGGVNVGATRVIYQEGVKEATISVGNNSTSTVYLVQSWVDEMDSNKKSAAFTITPPLFRLDSKKENILRIVKTADGQPNNRETAYWINVKTIPAVDSEQLKDKNSLQIAVKTRVKLFYRPKDLPGNPSEAYKSIAWSRAGNKMVAHNPTPYFITLGVITVNGKAVQGQMIAPNDQHEFTLSTGTSNLQVKYQAINDFGGLMPELSAAL